MPGGEEGAQGLRAGERGRGEGRGLPPSCWKALGGASSVRGSWEARRGFAPRKRFEVELERISAQTTWPHSLVQQMLTTEQELELVLGPERPEMTGRLCNLLLHILCAQAGAAQPGG